MLAHLITVQYWLIRSECKVFIHIHRFDVEMVEYLTELIEGSSEKVNRFLKHKTMFIYVYVLFHAVFNNTFLLINHTFLL
jgi:hypothetical protein